MVYWRLSVVLTVMLTQFLLRVQPVGAGVRQV
jgi:hypothetical protein